MLTLFLRSRRGFTLIELLIVVAIIAILAAIAVPNFLEAQTRAKVSRAKSDLRTLDVGVTAFTVDNNRNPIHKPDTLGWGTGYYQWAEYLNELTTPVAYLTSVSYPDPFRPQTPEYVAWFPKDSIFSYFWVDYSSKNNPTVSWFQMVGGEKNHNAFMVSSWGPDRVYGGGEWAPVNTSKQPYTLTKVNIDYIYDATNGTVSFGDIPRYGGEIARTF